MPVRGELKLFPRYARRSKRLGLWRDRVFMNFRSYLKWQGLKLTTQRKAIVEFLLDAKDHVGIDEVYKEFREKHLGIGRATVFRTLKLLQRCGMINRVSGPDGTGHYELKQDRPHHDHMICVDCGRIIEFESPTMEHFQNEAIRRHGFAALWHRHEVFGHCRACLRQRRNRMGKKRL